MSPKGVRESIRKKASFMFEMSIKSYFILGITEIKIIIFVAEKYFSIIFFY